jgi:hypothetical protein
MSWFLYLENKYRPFKKTIKDGDELMLIWTEYQRMKGKKNV